jgi:formylglycine-generating enzyme required for sulfatase activity
VKNWISTLAASLLAVAASAQTTTDFKPYDQTIANVPTATLKMVPIPAGKFLMGSPATEKGRQEDEGPQVEVTVEPFWMAATEVTHDQFEAFRFEDKDMEPKYSADAGEPDAVTRPTAQYIDLSWGMGKQGGFPANSMQPYTATAYCRWLWKKTGIFFRLPTEAEWEYAARAGSKGTYPAGVTAATLPQYAWFKTNSANKYQPVGQKKPNAWGLYDMLGNVAEWTMDMYAADYFTKLTPNPTSPFFVRQARPRSYHTTRGGGFRSTPEELRVADRLAQVEEWNQRDPQLPRSKWWMTDGDYVGFRVVRPLKQPTPEEAAAFYKEMLGE